MAWDCEDGRWKNGKEVTGKQTGGRRKIKETEIKVDG
jgi:hypothetical protein